MFIPRLSAKPMFPIVFLNGKYLDKSVATLHVSDLSILRGFGIFDYFRFMAGKPRFLADHLDRFYTSAELMGMDCPIDREELAAVVHTLIDRNDVPAGGIRFVMTGGYSENGYQPTAPNLLAVAYPFKPAPAEQFQAGCRVLLHQYERQLPRVKTTDYIEGIRLLPELKRRNADYPLYVDRDDQVRESDRSNFFIVRDGVLITPIDDILLGVTRKHLLRLAHELGIPTEERAVSKAELLAADEAILASSTKGAMPIAQINGQAIGDGNPGPMTHRLMEAWPAYGAALIAS